MKSSNGESHGALWNYYGDRGRGASEREGKEMRIKHDGEEENLFFFLKLDEAK